MKMTRIVRVVFAAFAVCFMQIANAVVVNIDARNNPPENPVLIFFTSGTYDVVPIDEADGGQYTAWYPFGTIPVSGCDANGENCTTGWAHSYQITSDEFDIRINIGTNGRSLYATEQQAFDNALSTSFTLTTDGMVGFQIRDSLYSDNINGVSLLVDAATVPLPASVWLFVSGLFGLIGVSKRKIIF